MLIQLHAASYVHTRAEIVRQILLAVISQWSIHDLIFHIQLHDPSSVINRFYADLHRRQFVATHQMELLYGTACGLMNMHVNVLTRSLFMKSYSLVYAIFACIHANRRATADPVCNIPQLLVWLPGTDSMTTPTSTRCRATHCHHWLTQCVIIGQRTPSLCDAAVWWMIRGTLSARHWHTWSTYRAGLSPPVATTATSGSETSHINRRSISRIPVEGYVHH